MNILAVSGGLIYWRMQLVAKRSSQSSSICHDWPCGARVCDVCGGGLVQRDDDTEQTIINRLDVYEKQTSTLKKYFNDVGVLYSISGTGSITDIQSQIIAIIGSGGAGDHS